MSWTGFKKQINRAGTQIMQKTGQIDKTDDREFQEEVRHFKVLENNASMLHKEAKAYLDSMRGMAGAQARIGDTLDGFYADNSDAAMTVHAYKRATEDLDSRIVTDIEGPYRATVLEPVGRMCSHFPEVNNAISKRNKKLLDYDSTRTKLRKLQDNPTDNFKAARAEKEAEEAQNVFETIDNALQSELPELLALRIPYLDPCFESLVRMQTKFAEESYERLGGVQRYLPDDVRDNYANGALDGQVEGALAEIRELSIAGMA